MNGVIIVDKPAGWTSHDVVNRVRRILNQRSIGHLGTLDPLATGVLPLVVGNLTRLAQFYTASEKTYEGVIRFGFATTTYDADGDPVAIPAHVATAAPGCPDRSSESAADLKKGSSPLVTLDQLQHLAAEFVGVITQMPPPFSAKKIHGVPAYKLARKHKELDLKPVQVEIKEFSITSLENDRATFRARVASGTYMRSVAHDLGQRLGCGAHLESLRRTGVAEFDISQAHTLEEIETVCRIDSERVVIPRRVVILSEARNLGFAEALQTADSPHPNPIDALFIHPRQLLPQFPSVTADAATAARIRNGRPVNLPELSRARHVKVFANQTDLIAIATRVAGSLFHPKIVFAGDLVLRS